MKEIKLMKQIRLNNDRLIMIGKSKQNMNSENNSRYQIKGMKEEQYELLSINAECEKQTDL